MMNMYCDRKSYNFQYIDDFLKKKAAPRVISGN